MCEEDWRNGGFGLYLHWPFCEAKCPYCDFNSFVRDRIDHARWADAYLSELDRYATLLPGRVLNSVFFGGGTPSLMNPDAVAMILDRIKSHWSLANNLEITLEANPTSVETGRFQAFAEAGINRVSMGVQALNDCDLRRLGRTHSTLDASRGFDIARKYFDRVSFDLIYARQDQDLSDWQAELSEAMVMAVDHLSLYQLTIEPGTAFGARYDKGMLRGLPDDDKAADMYEATQEICEAAGYAAYEVSNHAKSGAESRHNLIYWRYGDFAGIGPGAHGRLTLNGNRYATDTFKSPERWLQAVEHTSGEKSRHLIQSVDQAQEYLMMSLRLAEGTSLSRFSQLAGQSLNADTLSRLTDLGMLTVSDHVVKTTRRGRVVLNAVIEELLADADHRQSVVHSV